jgi:L-ascorbate metabolism protein UlaG (beta-lactamase superfamily)
MKGRSKMIRIAAVLLPLAAIAALALAVWMHTAPFGAKLSGQRLERALKSPNFKDGEFVNQIPTEVSTGSFAQSMWNFLVTEHPGKRPDRSLKIEKTDLRHLPDEDLIVWLGHSSYILKLAGKILLIDPVLVKGAPLDFMNRPFEGTQPWTPEDLPDADYVLITHDHWDHLDYDTQTAIRSRVKEVVVPLGIGADFEEWGFEEGRITDLDWGESKSFYDGFVFHCLPARHFSGRGFKRNQALWGSFVIEAPDGVRIYAGGDSGYGPHFKAIGEKFPGLDLAVLENGQYDRYWPQIHTLPQELPQVMRDLKARHYITVHHSKYSIANHRWDEPLQNELKAAAESGSALTVLKIGEVRKLCDLNEAAPQ